MQSVIVTSVYHLRKSRPLDYYLLPTVHLLEDLANSNVNICLFTDQSKDKFPQANNVHIFNVSVDELIKEMWANPNWRTEYSRYAKDSEQKASPELIAIWLGKMQMMKEATNYGDAVLWQDSGIRMPRIFKKRFEDYTKIRVYSEKYNEFMKTLNEHPLVFMKNDVYEKIYNNVDMSKFGKIKTLIRGGFIFARSNETKKLMNAVKAKWNFLVKLKRYGTEENPLTIYQWERKDSHLLLYDQWLDGLGLR